MSDDDAKKRPGRARDKRATHKPGGTSPQDPPVIHGGHESLDEPQTLDPLAIEYQDDPNEPISLDDSAIQPMGDTDSLDDIEDLPFPGLESVVYEEQESRDETVREIPLERPLRRSDEPQASGNLTSTNSLGEESASLVYEMSLEISFDPEEVEQSLDELSLDGQFFSPLLEIPPEKARHRQVLDKTIVHNMGRHLKRLGMTDRQFRQLKSTYYRERDRTDVSTTYFCSRDEPFLVAVALRYRSSFLSGIDIKVVFECPRTSPDLGVPPGTTDYYSIRRPDGRYTLFYAYSPEIHELGGHTGVGSFVQRGITQYVVDCYSFAMAQGLDFGKLDQETLDDPKYQLGDPHTPMAQLADFARVIADT